MNENKGRMPTKVELTLEQSQQGVSDDVLTREASQSDRVSELNGEKADLEDEVSKLVKEKEDWVSKKEATKLRAERQDLAARLKNEEIMKHNVIRHTLQVWNYKQIIKVTFSASYCTRWLEAPKVNRKEEAAIFKAADNVDHEDLTKFQQKLVGLPKK
ncbi:hypothetical protein Tco_0524833 [Tanacetum coccineum]